MAKIDQITMYDDRNYVRYDDSDSMTDYFHGYSLTMAKAAEWLKNDGGITVSVRVVNNNGDPKFAKRVSGIAKKSGYTVTYDPSISHMKDHNGYQYKTIIPHWTLTRVA